MSGAWPRIESRLAPKGRLPEGWQGEGGPGLVLWNLTPHR
jgi:hypothetical protein